VTEAAIQVLDVHKAFGATRAVDGASLSVPAGHLGALLGPSGSGKTTLLRMIAGFEVPDAGTVVVGGRTVAGPDTYVEPEDRRIGMVFQDGALFPHLTVAKNLAFGDPAEGRAEECLELVGLAGRAKAYPHELSGGERQRVALGRALAIDPTVVLLDEPFASLDAGLRVQLREDVARILHEAGATALLVTHDQQEALSMADEVVVMRAGRVEQDGPPQEVYVRPSSRWVAEFLGAAEVLPATVTAGTAACELGRFPASDLPDGDAQVVVRPELLLLGAADATDGVAATVEGRSFYGHDQLVSLRLATGAAVRCRTTGVAAWQEGDDVMVQVGGPVTVLAADPAAD
jgi:iron(III) transport system ATP-binding protein